MVGNDPYKIKLRKDIEKAWYEGSEYFKSKSKISGAELYSFSQDLAIKYGWDFGGEIAGSYHRSIPSRKT